MSKILVTGASGGLGQLVSQRLAGREDVVLGTRNPAPGGRRIDFDDPASLVEGFAGIGTLLLISAGEGEDDVVIARHEAAISAAEDAGVRHIVYTSLSSDGDHLPYALAHRWTERRLRGSSRLDWTVLRNGLYAEFLAFIAAPGPDGRITAPMGTGRLAAVAREDLAEVAARVAVSAASHAGRTYELTGERALGGADLAAALSVPYEPGSLAGARAAIAGAGNAAAFQVPMLVGTYSAIAGGFMDGSEAEASELARLLGRAPRSALDVYVKSVGGPA
ncbi:NAD(P)H-binding protein [Streptomyces sp. ISL-96]|uniref:NAD(P)H-binding protein n=1 Tax=Streptomyces sp. ISL-96 TaxID=2819191 RepID=UPI001BE9ADEE|nr:NAD(P)H-binding protein [Streptomyces sp. ISL-96]MBT2491502.1 NAD(P)H-binding protein [Streptomyces sp. ISL-96]